MSQDWFGDVLAFHEKFGCAVGTTPAVPATGTPELRRELIREEYEELLAALDAGDLPALADAITDLTYVVLGTAVSYGMDMRPVWNEVHRTNMNKEGGGTREDGKILKPAGWVAPDIAGVLARQESIRGSQP